MTDGNWEKGLETRLSELEAGGRWDPDRNGRTEQAVQVFLPNRWNKCESALRTCRPKNGRKRPRR